MQSSHPRNAIVIVLCSFILMPGIRAEEAALSLVPSFPRELAAIPVNGTRTTEDPVALRYAFNLGSRAASNVFECGDHISFLDDITCLETPHTDWAVPYQGPAPRILAFAGHRGYVRDVIELRHRSDFDFIFAMRPMMYHYAGYRHPSILRHFSQRYKKLLEQEWDVILLPAGDALNLLDGETMPRIAEKIRAGTPAVCVLNIDDWDRDMYAETLKIFHAISPLNYVKGETVRGPFVSSEDVSSHVIHAIAPEVWPASATVLPAKIRENADVLLSSGDSPIVATGMYGKGRVIAVVPPVLPHGADTASLYATADEPVMDDIYELKYSLLLKSLLWAAGQQPDVRMQVPDTLAVNVGQEVTVEVPVTGPENETCNAEYRLKGPWGAVITSGQSELKLEAAGSVLAVELPALSLNGMHRLDIWLKQAGQAVVRNPACPST